jgi:serine/threonine protein phosphatase PrpC
MPVTFATATDIGLVRQGNEDAAMAKPPVFAVADGMGGALAGEIASGMAIEALELYAAGTDTQAQDPTALLATVNEEIFNRGTSDAGRTGMGTTITAAVLTDGGVDLYHVGDSRAYRLRGGSLEQLTEDHSLVGEMVRRGEITEEAALVHPQRSIITRALGVEPTVESDSYHVDLEPGDLFLLCSDGLFSMVAPEAIKKIIAGSGSLNEAATGLITAANDGGGADNVTVVLFSPDGSMPAGNVTADEAANLQPDTEGGAGAQGDASGHHAGDRPWWRGWRALAAGGVVIVVLLAASTWYMTQKIYYLGVNDGRVSIFQGLPVELGPLSLSSLYRQSDIKVGDLEPFEQERVGRQELSSLETAEVMLDNYHDQLESKSGPGQERDSTTPRTTPTGAEF